MEEHDHGDDGAVKVTVVDATPPDDGERDHSDSNADAAAGDGAGASDDGSDAADAAIPADQPDDDDDNDNDDNGSLAAMLDDERSKSSMYEQKLKMALADYENLSRRTASEVEAKVMAGTVGIMSGVLDIRDDFVRARDAFARDGADTSGLDSVLRNMDALLERHHVKPIDALGEIFDPGMHEAISTEVDPMLDDHTITKELRRGYALKNTIIRPSMVVISKKE